MSNTREAIVSNLEATMKAAIIAAYPWVGTGCSRDVPEDLKAVDEISPENTPLVYLEEGDEDYPESENGWTRVLLPIHLTGVLKRQERLPGKMATIGNNLLAVMLKAAWNYTYPNLDVMVTAGGKSSVNKGPGQARVGVDINLSFVVSDLDP